MQISSNKEIYIVGKIWNDPNREEKTIKISNGRINSIENGSRVPASTPDSDIILLDSDEYIFPSLTNLHTHVGYNVFPLWIKNKVWKSRHHWRNNPEYKLEISELNNFIKDKWPTQVNPFFISDFANLLIEEESINSLLKDKNQLQEALINEVKKAHAIISEIYAVVGGTGLIQQTLPLDKEDPSDRSFIIRNTGNQKDLEIPDTQQVYSIVDFFRPDPKPSGNENEDSSIWSPVIQKSFNDFITSVNNGNDKSYATLAHIGEGCSGFLHGLQQDAYSKKEVEAMFDILYNKIDKENLKSSFLSLTHGNGIDTSDQRQMDFLREHNITLIWSPVSNLLLYNDTVNIKAFLQNGINICLGSDWSPSGTKHVLDELKFAAILNEKFNWKISHDQLFDMVTVNPLKALGLESSTGIEAGKNADLFVLKSTPSQSPLDSLLFGKDADISFVIVNGRMVYGLKEHFDKMKVDYENFDVSEGALISKYGISINNVLKFDMKKSLSLIDSLIAEYCRIHTIPAMIRPRILASEDQNYSRILKRLAENS
ncbi:MAG: amidohydrolase family protein [Bacteroidota bacterium]|jgi:hypothetical protein|nr:amidohydrolase family protein [Bacteroidota bacterium]